jgi:hypothetical protein
MRERLYFLFPWNEQKVNIKLWISSLYVGIVDVFEVLALETTRKLASCSCTPRDEKKHPYQMGDSDLWIHKHRYLPCPIYMLPGRVRFPALCRCTNQRLARKKENQSGEESRKFKGRLFNHPGDFKALSPGAV